VYSNDPLASRRRQDIVTKARVDRVFGRLSLPGVTELFQYQHHFVALTQVAHDLHRRERELDERWRNNDLVVDSPKWVKEYIYDLQDILTLPEELLAKRLEVGQGTD
jgi:hypothetical protein